MAYCTPLLIDVDGETQLICLGSDALVAHDPATGEELWWFTFSGYSNVAKPVYAKGMLFFPSGFGTPIFYAIRAGGRGDVTETNRALDHHSQVRSRAARCFAAGRRRRVVHDHRLGHCRLLRRRDGQVALAGSTGGQVLGLAGLRRRAYLLPVDEAAMTTVLEPGKSFKKLATNKLDGHAQASPAIVDGAIFCAPTRIFTASKNFKAALRVTDGACIMYFSLSPRGRGRGEGAELWLVSACGRRHGWFRCCSRSLPQVRRPTRWMRFALAARSSGAPTPKEADRTSIPTRPIRGT